MKGLLTKWDYLNILLLIIFNLILTDLPLQSFIKVIISVLPFVILFIIYFIKKNIKLFYIYLLIYTFSFPFGPRDLEGFRSGELMNFYSYTNLSIGFISLSIFTLIFFTIIEVKKNKIYSNFIYKGFVFFIFLIGYSVINIIINGFYLNFFITDLKPFLMFYFGCFLGISFWKRFNFNIDQIFLKIIVILSLVYFGKTLIYILMDLKFGNELSNFGTIPYLFLPILFTVMFTIKDFKTRIFLILATFVSSFSISRGFFIMLGSLALIIPFFYININNFFRVTSSYLFFIIIVLTIYSFSYLFLSETAQIFLSYKLNFFTGEVNNSSGTINRSTYIRILEFQNIFDDAVSNPMWLFFGKGLGSYFEFNEYPISTSLLNGDSNDAYSEDQLKLNKYFRPHTFFITALLKGGLVLLIVFSYYNLRHFIRMAKEFKKKKMKEPYFIIFSGIFVSLFFFYFWIPEFLFLNGFVLGYFSKRLKYEL